MTFERRRGVMRTEATTRFREEDRRDLGEMRLPLPVRFVVPLSGGRVARLNSATLGARATVSAALLASAFAVWWFAARGVGIFEFIVFMAMYLVSAIGVSVGYHRLFSHHAFGAPIVIRAMLGIFGAIAMQGHISYWASIHRKHHRFADGPEDPHSPRRRGGGRMSGIASFYHGFIGWMFDGSFCLYADYVADLTRDPLVRWIDRYYPLWIAGGIVLPGIAGAIWYGTTDGYLSCLLAGGPLRVVYGFVASGLVNSLAHVAGRQPFPTDDNSRNNPIVSTVSLTGEGLHNNHHEFPYSASFALLPGQVDVGFLFIRALARIGWVRDVRLVPTAAIAKHLVRPWSTAAN